MIPLPESEGYIAYEAKPYAPGWVSSADAYSAAQLLAYGEACRQEERERCAKLCELLSIDTRDDHWDAITADQCAYSIRSCTP